MRFLEGVSPYILGIIGIFLAIQVPMLLLTFFVALREKHKRAIYVRVDESEALPSNAYMDVNNTMATKHGFAYQGVCRAGNNAIYKLRYDTWVSPDRNIFAVVGAGSMVGLVFKATWLTSKFVDGRVIVTVDQPGGMSADLSGMTEWKVIANADFSELLAKHQARIEEEMTPVAPYSARDPLGEQIELIAGRADRMARAGYIYFFGEHQDEWRFTVWGAVVRVADSYKRIFIQIMKNYGRRTMSRPGDPGYVSSQHAKTRNWLRYVEFGLWITILVSGRLWSQPGPVNPEQAAFRALVPLGAFLGLLAIWVWRFRMSQKTGDPQQRRRGWYAVATAAAFLAGGFYMVRPYHEPQDDVNDCKVLVGAGRVYVVVETTHSVMLTSRLAKLLRWARIPTVRRVVLWNPSVHILESDGASVRSARLPEEAAFGEVMPVGKDLYIIEPLGEDAVFLWRDGQLVAVPADEGAKILKGLADDLATQCASQGWEYTLLAGDNANRFSKSITIGDRKVLLELELVRSRANSARVLKAKLEVAGAKPLVQTYPSADQVGL